MTATPASSHTLHRNQLLIVSLAAILSEIHPQVIVTSFLIDSSSWMTWNPHKSAFLGWLFLGITLYFNGWPCLRLDEFSSFNDLMQWRTIIYINESGWGYIFCWSFMFVPYSVPSLLFPFLPGHVLVLRTCFFHQSWVASLMFLVIMLEGWDCFLLKWHASFLPFLCCARDMNNE